jgi:hypothetical protein
MAYWCGKGTTIKHGSTTLAQVVSITPPAVELGNVETTHLTSTARENKGTIVDPGEASFSLEWDPANSGHQALWTAFQAGTTESWTITIMSGAATVEIDFDGHIQNFGVDELSVDSVAVIPVTIKISALPTITYDSGA